jgi:hypothetical protein
MTNKLLLSTLIASSFFIATQANAADGTGTANFKLVTPIKVLETTPMEFGDISILTTGSCELDTADNVVGVDVCQATGATPASGTFAITAADSTVNTTVSVADTSVTGVTFTPNVAATAIVSSGTAEVKVGGKIDIVAGSAAEGTHALTYTLSVVYP